MVEEGEPLKAAPPLDRPLGKAELLYHFLRLVLAVQVRARQRDRAAIRGGDQEELRVKAGCSVFEK